MYVDFQFVCLLHLTMIPLDTVHSFCLFLYIQQCVSPSNLFLAALGSAGHWLRADPLMRYQAPPTPGLTIQHPEPAKSVKRPLDCLSTGLPW